MCAIREYLELFGSPVLYSLVEEAIKWLASSHRVGSPPLELPEGWLTLELMAECIRDVPYSGFLSHPSLSMTPADSHPCHIELVNVRVGDATGFYKKVPPEFAPQTARP